MREPRIYEEKTPYGQMDQWGLAKIPTGGVEYFPPLVGTQIRGIGKPRLGDLRYNIMWGVHNIGKFSQDGAHP